MSILVAEYDFYNSSGFEYCLNISINGTDACPLYNECKRNVANYVPPFEGMYIGSVVIMSVLVLFCIWSILALRTGWWRRFFLSSHHLETQQEASAACVKFRIYVVNGVSVMGDIWTYACLVRGLVFQFKWSSSDPRMAPVCGCSGVYVKTMTSFGVVCFFIFLSGFWIVLCRARCTRVAARMRRDAEEERKEEEKKQRREELVQERGGLLPPPSALAPAPASSCCNAEKAIDTFLTATLYFVGLGLGPTLSMYDMVPLSAACVNQQIPTANVIYSLSWVAPLSMFCCALFLALVDRCFCSHDDDNKANDNKANNNKKQENNDKNEQQPQQQNDDEQQQQQQQNDDDSDNDCDDDLYNRHAKLCEKNTAYNCMCIFGMFPFIPILYCYTALKESKWSVPGVAIGAIFGVFMHCAIWADRTISHIDILGHVQSFDVGQTFLVGIFTAAVSLPTVIVRFLSAPTALVSAVTSGAGGAAAAAAAGAGGTVAVMVAKAGSSSPGGAVIAAASSPHDIHDALEMGLNRVQDRVEEEKRYI